MPTREEILRNLKSRDTVYSEDFDEVLKFTGEMGTGALVYGTVFQSIPSGVATDVADWDTVVYDDLGFFNLASPSLFTVPLTDPVIQRVQLYFQFTWQPNATGLRNFFLEQNGVGGVRGGIIQNGTPPSAAAPLGETAYSMPIPCVPGDTFNLVVNQDSGIALALSLLGYGIAVAR